jgi:hypothetical protein
VLRTTGSFRSEQEVDDLWDGMCERTVAIVGEALRGCQDPEVFLGTKAQVLIFIQTLEVSAVFVAEEDSHTDRVFDRVMVTRCPRSTLCF